MSIAKAKADQHYEDAVLSYELKALAKAAKILRKADLCDLALPLEEAIIDRELDGVGRGRGDDF